LNRFFTTEDKKVDEVEGFKLPNTWWSRPYEYAFAMDFVVDGEVVLDVGCGIEHPFKNYLANKCKTVGLDLDRRVLEIKNSKVEFVVQNILSYKPDFKFDKIFIISTLEHTTDYLEEKLENLKNMLKEDGKIILTVDYPTLKPEKLIEYAKKVKLMPTSDFNDTINENALYHSSYNLNVYNLILEHEKNQDKSLNLNDRKTKIEKPHKTKER